MEMPLAVEKGFYLTGGFVLLRYIARILSVRRDLFDKTYVSASTQLSRLLIRKVLVLATVSVLATQILVVAGTIYVTYAITGPPPPAAVSLHLDLDTAEGFERVRTLDYPSYGDISEFVLRQGATGTFNIALTSFETNKTVTAALAYGGIPPFNHGWYRHAETIPDGITYIIEPANMTLAPNSTTTAVMRISAAPATPVRGYNLTVTLNLEYPIDVHYYSDDRGYETLLTIEGVSPINTTTSTEKATTSYVTETATLTSTATTTTLIEGVAEPAVYAWAIGATTITAVLAVVLLRRRS